jgi:hypothetical protein
MYAAPFGEKNFRNDVPKKTYSNFPAGNPFDIYW